MRIKDNALVHVKQAPCPQPRYILGASTNKAHPANTYTTPRAISFMTPIKNWHLPTII